MIYYQHITHEYARIYRNLAYPEIVIYSLSFREVADWLNEGRWQLVTQKTTEALKALQSAGADFGLIACNTLHIVFNEIRKQSPIPLISIVEATVDAVEHEGIQKIGLLGTCLTMNSTIYKECFETRGIATLIPEKEEQQFVARVIDEELVKGVVRAKSRRMFKSIVQGLESRGAEGIVLGCTEISQLMKQRDHEVHLFDTALIHAKSALAYAMG
jgi:aspartate racemase